MNRKKRIGLPVTLAAFSLFPGTSSFAEKSAPTEPVELIYQPIMHADGRRFDKMQVTLRFPGDSDGETRIDLPSEWGGFTKLYENLDDIRVQGASTERSGRADFLILRHKPGAAITLSYNILGLKLPEKLSGADKVNEYRPVITDEYFHLIGETVVARPDHISGDAPARFTVKGMPKGSSFASDLEHSRNGQIEFDALVESIAVGGDFRILTAGNNIRLAIQGKFASRDDTGWIDAFKRISGAVSDYWTTAPGPYLVTILPFEPSMPGATSVGGTGRRDVFAFFSTTNAEVDKLDQIMAHEMTHSWMPRRVGGIASEDDLQKEQYWLSEGFTDFATWRALVRQGLWSPERYIQELNDTLAEYDGSSVRTMPNADAAKLFWSSQEGQRIAYVRGALFAEFVDNELQNLTSGSSLRLLLLGMQRRTSDMDSDGRALPYLRTEMKRAGLSAGELISRYIDRGGLIEFPANFLRECGHITVSRRPEFHRGFDIQTTQANGNIIAGVIENGPAWRAGLRNGMKLVGRSGGTIGNSMIEIAYDVEDQGVAKTLRWMPQAAAQETRHIFVAADLAKPDMRKACIATLSR